MGDRITVCATCREGAGRALADHLREKGIEVRLVECLNACSAPLALAVTGEGKAPYLFAGLGPEAHAEEVVGFAAGARGSPPGARGAADGRGGGPSPGHGPTPGRRASYSAVSSAATSSAICTAFRAAPLRRLSLETKKARPWATVSSRRMRPT